MYAQVVAGTGTTILEALESLNTNLQRILNTIDPNTISVSPIQTVRPVNVTGKWTAFLTINGER